MTDQETQEVFDAIVEATYCTPKGEEFFTQDPLEIWTVIQDDDFNQGDPIAESLEACSSALFETQSGAKFFWIGDIDISILDEIRDGSMPDFGTSPHDFL